MKLGPHGSVAKRGVADCTLSLAIALQNAGGGFGRNILDMTLGEFISDVAGQNGIRFTYEGGEK